MPFSLTMFCYDNSQTVYAVWGLERSPRYDALSYTHVWLSYYSDLTVPLPNNN